MLEHDGSQFVIANLDTDNITQVDLDLIFTEGEEVTFFLKGEGTVHLSGYVLDFEDDYDDEFDEAGLSDEEESDVDLPLNENAKRVKAAESLSAKKAKVDEKAHVANGISDDEDDEESDDDFDILGNLDEENDEEDEEDDEEDEEEEGKVYSSLR